MLHQNNRRAQNHNHPDCHVGIDVSKDTLDVCLLSAGDNPLHRRFANAPDGWQALVTLLERQPVKAIVLEATGGYERDIVRVLQLANLPVAVVNPFIARRFAQGLGLMVKTDKVDAFMLAVHAQKANLRFKSLNLNKNVRLSELNTRRRQLARMLVMETNRIKQLSDAWLVRRAQCHLDWLKREHDELMEEIRVEINRDAQMKQRYDLVTSMKGVGHRVAAALMAELPELGHLNRGQIASLVGVAPFNRDSGRMRGQRRIFGGRAWLRSQLYMAAVVASRFNPAMSQFYKAKLKQAKPKKLILTAIMRKMLITLNSMVKRNEKWHDATHSTTA